jgi:hydrogenase expression/formation protein HypC
LTLRLAKVESEVLGPWSLVVGQRRTIGGGWARKIAGTRGFGFGQLLTTNDQRLQFGGCRMCLAIPGKIVEISSENSDSALVDVVGVRRRIDLGLLLDDKPVPGDWVLIHVGFAMSKISELDALDQMNTLRALGEIDGAMQEVQGYGLEDMN